jgi:hypothetical protein
VTRSRLAYPPAQRRPTNARNRTTRPKERQ